MALLAAIVTGIVASSGSVDAEDSRRRLLGDVSHVVDNRLTRCEQRVLEAVTRGTAAWCGEGTAVEHPSYDASRGERWSEERTLRARVIRAIVVSPAVTTIGPAGIEIHGARIVGTLDLAHARLPFRLAIDQSYVEQEMNLSGAEIKQLQLVGTHAHGLMAEHLRVLGSMDLTYGFRSDGGIHLVGADIGGFLGFDGAALYNRGGSAIIGDRLRVRDSVLFRAGFTADGEVRLINAVIQGDLAALGGTFSNPGGRALDAGGAHVGGIVHLNKDVRLDKSFTVAGQVTLAGSQIGSDVYLDGARFEPKSVLNLYGATIKGVLMWTKCTAPATVGAVSLDLRDVTIDLRDASVSAIADDRDCWPAPGSLYLDGFRYRRFTAGPPDAASRLAWLRLQPAVSADSYQQLARILGDTGDPAGAKTVLINLELDRRRAERPNPALALWNWLLYLTIGYGYAAWRALYPALAIVIVGGILFRRGFRAGLVTPTDKEIYLAFEESGKAPNYYPRFSAAVYSLETFLPVVTFGQKASWVPNPARGAVRLGGLTSGRYLQLYLWVHIALGWLLTTMVIAGLTGLLKTS